MLDNMNKQMLAIGAAVELEHTKDTKQAMRIAMDHLKQDPEYYSKLGAAGLIDEPEARKMLKQYLKPTVTEQESERTEAAKIKAVQAQIIATNETLKDLKMQLTQLKK